MPTPHRIPQHINGDLHWFLRTRFCRVVAQVAVFALVFVDAPVHLLKDALAQSAVVFGPENFVRATGAPQTVTRTFNVTNPSGPATLCLANGGTNSQFRRVSSATVTLNNTQVVRQNDFNQQVSSITRSVTLATTNTLQVRVASAPGSGFTLTIVRGGVANCPNSANRAPVANAGPDQSAPVNTLITLDGSGSTDADGNTLTYQWTLTAPNGSNVPLSNPTAVKPTFTLTTPGTYTARLIVNDGTVNSAPDTVLISTINSKPVADAGDDRTVALNSRVTLDGRDSSDADGDPLTYRWTLKTKPTNSTATLDSTTSAQPSFTADKPGNYEIELIVNDGTIDSAPDTVVVSTLNSQPVADAGDAQTVTVNTLVQLDGRGSTDADNDPLTYRWSFTSSPQTPAPTLTNPTSAQPSFTPTVPGLYIVQLIVNDSKVDSVPVTVSITVNPVVVANNPPTITSIPVIVATVGQAYSYDVEATDPDAGDTLTYSLTAFPTGMTIHNGTGLIQWTPEATQTGPHNVTVQVSDGRANGTVTQNFTITVSVAPPTNRPPTITSTPGTTAQVGQPYSYDVEATDPDAGDTLTYSLTTQPAGMTIVADTGVISWTPAANQTGPQNVTVQVSDGKPNGTVTQSFAITVSAVQTNRPPVAQDDQYAVRRGQTLTVPAPGVLQNDSDPDNNPLTAQSVTTPTKGTATLAADGSFTYTPTPPPANSTEPVLKFSYSDPNMPVFGGTRVQPLVIDLDKDSVAEIVFYAQGPFPSCRLIAVHGNDGSAAFSVNASQPTANPPIQLCDPFSELAAGDIDGDGFPEIIAVDGHTGSATDSFRSQLLAFEHDGTYKWTSQDVVEDPLIDSMGGGITKPLIADINGDGTPEIVVRYFAKGPLTPAGLTGEDYVTVFDNRGRILWTARGGGSGNGDLLGNVVAEDIDLDGDLEILAADDVFDHQGQLLRSAATCSSCLNPIDIAVANLDDDPFPEIVYLDRFAQLYVYEHTGVLKWGPLDTGAGASLLTIGDVDGDGKAEIVVTADRNIAVVSRDGASIRSIPVPLSNGSNFGNTTIFDLNGDGKPELIYLAGTGPFDTGSGTGAAQFGAVMIFDGQTGTHLHSIKSPNSGNQRQGPVVADVDGDGSAEIVTGGWNGSPMIHVFEAKNGQWAKARPIYNQFNYSVTNVNNDGTIPARPEINWLTPGLNNYRVNIPLPQERTGDKDQFTYKANDGTVDSNTATVKVDILPPNTAPSILSIAPTTASPNLEYLYAVRAVDPDAGEVLTYAVSQGPTGMTINANTGLIRWTPTPTQVGNHVIALKVTDSQNQSAFQGFTITVGAVVTVPSVVGLPQAAAQTALTTAGLIVGTVITSPSATVPAGSVISQEPSAGTGVPSGSAVNLVVSSGPQGVSVPNVVGQTQSAAQSAITSVGLTVGTVTTAPSTTVPAGNVISQTPAAGTTALLGTAVNLVVSVGIITLDGLASIVVEPATPLILVGNTQAFTATGIFNDGTGQNLTAIVTWTSSSPSVASIAPNGVATGVADGTTTITATAGTISGNTTLTIRARVGGDAIDPTAAITTPIGGAEVTSPIDVIGTATDTNFLKYELAYAPAGETNFTILSTGTTAVTNGVLGKLDPTLLINDLYDLKLTVYDRNGNQSVATVTVQVTREQKVGLFTITFQDLQIPLSGIPITINRTYDSRDKGQGDFGIGWRLDIQTLRLRPNREQGSGWIVRHPSGLSYTLEPVGEHKISLTLPDGKVEEFDMVVNPSSSGVVPFSTVTASYIPRAGTLGTLIPLDNTSLLITDPQIFAVNDVTLLDDSTLNTFNPKRFRYIGTDGTMFDIDRTKGVESVRDLNGNTLTIGATGISHSSGKSVTFTRDAQGRIIQITDPAGHTQRYAYNTNNDLTNHTDQLNNVTRFTYNRSHGLLDIIDPLGTRYARCEYDSDGRLIAFTDANGNRVEHTHNLGARLTSVRHRDGQISSIVYDDVGNMLSETNPLGDTTSFSYDSHGNLLTETNPLGHTTTSTYDSRDNLLTNTNALGHPITMTYNARGQTRTETDAKGNTTSYSYDAQGNLLTEHDPLGNTTSFTYDTQGNVLSERNALGQTTQFEYDTTGNFIKAIDPLGRETTAIYDANGNSLSQTTTRTAEDGSQVTMTVRTVHDMKGRLIEEIDPLGNTTHTQYDANGEVITSTDPQGNRTQLTYDARGYHIETQFADGTTESESYDAEGRKISARDAAGHGNQFAYDSLGRYIRTTRSDGSAARLIYDPISRITSRFDENGNETSFTYDAAGRLTSVRDALGNVTSQTFDANGNRTSVTDANGRTTSFDYDANDRLIKTTFADGTFTTITYDALGRRVAETDQAGNMTRFTYDAIGRLATVSDSLGQSTSFTYDEVGNLVAQTDAIGHTIRRAYDNLGRPIKRTLPLGMSETFTYDVNSNVTSHTNFNGQTFSYTYDSRSRLIRKTLPDGSLINFTYTPTGQRDTVTDARGTTTYRYDARDRLVELLYPDATRILYTYDAIGNRTSVTSPAGTTTYTYDVLSRLTTVTAPDGGVTTYSYDPRGNKLSTSYPNGTTTRYTYDALNRVIAVENIRADLSVITRQTYTLAANGNRLQMEEHTGRRVDYSYDALDRLTREVITDPVLGNETRTYIYDAVGNRLTKTDNTGVSNYAYDANDRVMSAGSITYAYDGNGNTLSSTSGTAITTYTYDAENRVKTVQTPSHAVSYSYDVDGIRVGQIVDGTATAFIVDTNRAYAQVLEERDAGGGLLVQYTYGQELISLQQGGIVSFYHQDAQGSTRALTNAAGATTDTYLYDAFGNLTRTTGSTGNRHLYTGEQFDSASGLYYLRARHYDPAIGRFTTRDTFPGDATLPLSLHPYLYVHANPTNLVDPSGNFAVIDVLISNVVDSTLEKADLVVKTQVQHFVKKQVQKKLVKRLGQIVNNASRLNEKVIRNLKNAAQRTRTSMFVIGASLTEVTANKMIAIAGGHFPLLTYLGKNVSHDREFLKKKCGAAPRGDQDCDEYPYSSSFEGGDQHNAHAALVNASQNRSEGAHLGTFYSRCLTGGGDFCTRQ